MSIMSMHFPVTILLFYAFAALLIASAFMVIVSKHPVQSALYLVVAFFASSALWIMSHAEFLGLILILVYVGAVMTLFLFVVMTVPFNLPPVSKNRWSYALFALIIVLLFTSLMFKVMYPFGHINYQFKDTELPGMGGAYAIGMHLYTDYVFPFEIAGLILLVAIVAAISLSWKTNRQKIVTNPSEQIAVSAKSRLKIIKMASEVKSASDDTANKPE